MDPTLFLQIGAFAMMALSITSLFTHFILCPPEPEYPQVPTWPQLMLRSLVVIFSILWSSIGLDLYSNLIKECKDTSKGKMLMAWSIIQLFNGIMRCCGVCTKINIRRQIVETNN